MVRSYIPSLNDLIKKKKKKKNLKKAPKLCIKKIPGTSKIG